MIENNRHIAVDLHFLRKMNLDPYDEIFLHRCTPFFMCGFYQQVDLHTVLQISHFHSMVGKQHGSVLHVHTGYMHPIQQLYAILIHSLCLQHAVKPINGKLHVRVDLHAYRTVRQQ